MPRKHMPASVRRALILKAAREVFARHGYAGARTLQIARAAKVSEALVYRHFPSKLALYRAVVRQVFREQDTTLKALQLEEPGAKGLVEAVHAYLSAMVAGASSSAGLPDTWQNARMMLASLAGDGHLATLVYRRAQKANAGPAGMAHATARAAQEMTGHPIDIADTLMFIEHVGTMLGAVAALQETLARPAPYALAGKALAREAAWFCCRGMGISDAVIARCLGELEPAPAAEEP